MKWRPGDTSSWIYLFFFFNTLVLNKCHDIKIEVLPCSCSKHYQKRIGFHKSIVRPPEVSCKIHVDEFVADNFLALRKRAKINCFVTTIINYREENVGRNEQKRWKQNNRAHRKGAMCRGVSPCDQIGGHKFIICEKFVFGSKGAWKG